MQIKTPKLSLLLLLFAALTLSQAQGAPPIQVTAKLNETTVTNGSQVTYTIILNSQTTRLNITDIKITKNPQFRGLRLLTQQFSQSSKSSIINGAFTSSLLLSLNLQAQQVGVAQITKGQLTYKGASYDIPPLTLTVLKDTPPVMPPHLKDLNILSARSQDSQIQKEIQGRLFARLIPSKTDPYLQETITLDLIIYTDSRDIQSKFRDLPDWQRPTWGPFFPQEEKFESISWKQTTINQKPAFSLTIARIHLTPQKAGKTTIPASAIQAALRRPATRRSFEENFFSFGGLSYDRIPISLPIAPTEINVQPLPTQDRPPSFEKAVGRFDFTAKIDRPSMTQDDLLTLTCTITGQGYLGSISPPRLPPLPEWETIGQPQEKTQTAPQTKKTYEYILRPKTHGNLVIPPIAYAHFNPQQKRYIEQTPGPYTIKVTEGKKQDLQMIQALTTPHQNTQTPINYGETIAHIHTQLPPIARTQALYKSKLFLPLLLAPLLLLTLALAHHLRQQYLHRHQDHIHKRNAHSRAQKQLKAAQAKLKKGDIETIHQKIANTLRQYIATKINRSPQGLTLEEIQHACQEHNTPDSTTSTLLQTLEHLDNAQYLTQTPSPDQAQKTLKETQQLLQALDKTFS